MAEEDILYGKNRHLFGGIEPQNVTNLTVELTSDSYNPYIVTIAGNLKDTVIDDQLICSVDGVVIRRGTSGYPKNEFEGEVIENVSFYDTSDFNHRFFKNDKNIDPNATYYYSIFPYSKQGVYNRHAANRIAFNEPKPLTSFTAESVYDRDTDIVSVKLDCVLPQGVKGALIARSFGTFPQDGVLNGDSYGVYDAKIIADISSSTTIYDNDLEPGKTCYYRAFPYTENEDGKIYCYTRGGNDNVNQAWVTPRKYTYFFGYDIVLSDSNPSTRVTYPSDVDNANYTTAAMDYSTKVFNYGGWPSEAGYKFMPRPCMLKYDGTVDYYLNPNDYTKKEDGTTSDIASTSYGGNAMVEWPKIYTKRWEENGVYHFRCSDFKIDDDYECWCNYDKNNNQIDHFYTSIYTGESISSKLRSLSGRNHGAYTVANSINYAKANGSDNWFIEVLADRLLIQDLLVMITKTTDVQAACGMGNVSANGFINTGTMDTKGLFWGSKSITSTEGVKVFGMENYWGNAWRPVAGWIGVNGVQKIKITRGTYDGTTASDYNTTGSGYINATTKVTAQLSGNGKFNTVTPYGRFSIDATGSTSTYECDAFLFYGSDYGSDTYYALASGYNGIGKSCGPFTVYLSKGTDESDIGAALSCKPSAT